MGPRVDIFTDGACSPNPGIGGWGALLVAPDHGGARKEISGAEAETTNNRMELTAAIRGLEALKGPSTVRLVTDSKYVADAFRNGWLAKWKVNGWQNSNRQPVQNADLWRTLDRLTQTHTVTWEWVKGHAQHPENERADQLAVAAREALRAQLSAA